MFICICRLGNVYFSFLNDHTELCSHCGPTNLKLRLQLPIILHPPDANSVFSQIQVGLEKRTYHGGIPFIFDDSFIHSVDDSSMERVVLVVDLWHPALLSIRSPGRRPNATASAETREGLQDPLDIARARLLEAFPIQSSKVSSHFHARTADDAK